ncbi:hypothetical protein [Dolichospermum heterosporum]|uniref:Uncharacterized protein n=1 Tax=Dolichospermum heterosporum TAC447 TaxID=747523 RepID=A0ABY5M532_9CYAN|nr:hypothetical protein [Dolichospermum heterosporum]UUO18088.1 hypothetical protein NG743_23820 [Dolichospermum heterosporum TAC447]
MTTDAFEQTNWVWQFSLFQQQVGEWVEYQFSRFETTRGLREGWEPRLFRARGKAYPCGFNRCQYSQP